MKNLLIGITLLTSMSSFAGDMFVKHELKKDQDTYGRANKSFFELFTEEAINECEAIYKNCSIIKKERIRGNNYTTLNRTSVSFSSYLVIVYGEDRKLDLNL